MISDEKIKSLAEAKGKCFPVPKVPELKVCFEYEQEGINVWAK